MATYEYRCSVCGPFTVRRAIEAPDRGETCPTCAAPADRVYTPPLLSLTPPALARARAAEEKSSDRPDVVGSVPPSARAGPSRPTHPAWSRLPKP